MFTTVDNIEPSELQEICRANHIRRLAVFGSATRSDFKPESDVDVIVDFENGFVPTFFSLSNLSDELRPVFGDREVDLVQASDLHWYIRDEILNSAKVIYEKR